MQFYCKITGKKKRQMTKACRAAYCDCFEEYIEEWPQIEYCYACDYLEDDGFVA